jgi:hypothetical protein
VENTVLEGKGTRRTNFTRTGAMSIYNEIRTICAKDYGCLPDRPALTSEVIEAEKELGFTFPAEYRQFLLEIGGACIGAASAIGLRPVPMNGPGRASTTEGTKNILINYPWIKPPCALIEINGSGYPLVLLPNGNIAFCNLDSKGIEVAYATYNEWLKFRIAQYYESIRDEDESEQEEVSAQVYAPRDAWKEEDCERRNRQHKWYNCDNIHSGCYFCGKIVLGQLWKK